VLAARQVRSGADLDFSLQHLEPPSTLLGMEPAVDLLARAIATQRHIVIVADYDADGATACATLMLGLKAFGASRVSFVVPDRFRHGYGLSPGIVDIARARGAELLVTVDNGIASHAGVDRARELGIGVIVTDHHLPGASLPAADAIVNPNQPGDTFPSKCLAGVGVAFYVLAALRARLAADGERRLPKLADLLDLVALGTVADLVPLDRNNRILVAQGIARIQAGCSRPGIVALLRRAGRGPGSATAADLGFVVAPRLNAAGRLDDMGIGIECLLCDDGDRAEQLAGELDRLNNERREIESAMQEQALDRLDAGIEGNDNPAICLFDEQWHEGVVGLVASRLRERTGRPAVVFAPSADGHCLKGSARSVPGLHIRDVLARVDSLRPGLIARFGGHAMAAGLTLAGDRLAAFRGTLNQVVHEMSAGLEVDELLSDGPLGEEISSVQFALDLRNLCPWGQGFPEPVFDNRFEVVEQRVVGERHLKLKVRREEGGAPIDAIGFRRVVPGAAVPRLTRIHAAYRLVVNEFRGISSPELIIEHLSDT
jgi:single-stranded-DNA-specific exonuclease